MFDFTEFHIRTLTLLINVPSLPPSSASLRYPLPPLFPRAGGMDSLRLLSECSKEYPGFQDRVGLSHVFLFIRQISLLKNEIILAQRCLVSPSTPPQVLPPSVVKTLAKSLCLQEHDVVVCWNIFKQLAWRDEYMAPLHAEPSDALRKNGQQFGISAFSRSPVVSF